MTRPSLWRVIGVPLVILLVAGALWVWESGRRAARIEQVRLFVEALVDEAAAGRDLAAALASSDPLLRRHLIEALDEATAGGRTLRVSVSEGEAPQAGHPPEPATHTAMIEAVGRPVLGLRLLHEGDSRPITVIGLWRPPQEAHR